MSIVLKPFQETICDAIVTIVNDTAEKILDAPGSRSKISAAQGCILVEAPTASGKTVTIASALSKLRSGVPTTRYDRRKVVWFWFAPFSELVGQTIAAIRQDVDLSVRDPREDRERIISQSGDVFVSTWQSVSAKDTASRRIRNDAESMPSIDSFVGQLRDDGFFIGAVVDEAHHNFKTAPQALAFYIEVLKPDFTIMATATPNDADLAQFQKFAGITEVNHLSVSRDDVVRAGLNKTGVKAFYFKGSTERDEALIDYDQIAILAAVARHNEIKLALGAEGISLTPLLLVQVENYKESVDRARALLLAAGVDSDAIAVHTSDEPDKNLRSIAHDEQKEALIFKMAVAMGFDVPRAWTLVSMRSSRSVQFGLQVIGRIMRVHFRLQGRTLKNPDLLTYGHVFLSNSEAQPGLAGAADEIKAVATEIRTVTDNVLITEVNSRRVALTDPNGGFMELLLDDPGAALAGPALREPRENPAGFVEALFDFVTQAQEQLSESEEPRRKGDRSAHRYKFEYPFIPKMGAPLQLDREYVAADYSNIVDCIATRIDFGPNILALVGRELADVKVTVDDLFEHAQQIFERRVAISPERIASAAQLAFRFNDSIDPRDLKRALVKRLQTELRNNGHAEQSQEILRRTLDLALFFNKSLLSDACKACMGRSVGVQKGEPVPPFVGADAPLPPAKKNVYAVFVPGMNSWELNFADVLDRDATGTILWWLRNVHNTKWACRIIQPNGHSYYPDFVVGVAGRKTPDNIALAETKERIEDYNSGVKTRVPHKTYGSALMVTWNKTNNTWEVVDFVANLDRNQALRIFKPDDLTLLFGAGG